MSYWFCYRRDGGLEIIPTFKDVLGKSEYINTKVRKLNLFHFKSTYHLYHYFVDLINFLLFSFLKLCDWEGMDSIDLDNAAHQLGLCPVFSSNNPHIVFPTVSIQMCRFLLACVHTIFFVVVGVESRHIYEFIKILESIGVIFISFHFLS